MSKTLHIYRLFFFLFLVTSLSFGQSTKQKQLEQKRKTILKDIREINQLLKNNKAESSSLLSKLEDVDLKIKTQQRLVQITNQQANLINSEIKTNQKKINALETDLSVLKKNYAQMVVRSYKSKSKQSKLMFLLSSDNFLQAYKRFNYIKQIKKHQKKQADSISSKTEQLHHLNAALLSQKQEKEKLIQANKATQKKLLQEKNAQQQLISHLRKDEATYKARILKKQKERAKVDARIERIINDAIAKANRKTGGSAKNNKSFTLTAEAKALAKSFGNNKGKLPWPTKTGVLTRRPGKKQHNAVRGVYTTTKGIEITTHKNTDARSVFKGEVYAIQKIRGANKAVIVRHGNYLSVYSNLEKVYVTKGDLIDTKQAIGRIGTNNDNKTILKFYLYQNSKNLNPTQWIYKM